MRLRNSSDMKKILIAFLLTVSCFYFGQTNIQMDRFSFRKNNSNWGAWQTTKASVKLDTEFLMVIINYGKNQETYTIMSSEPTRHTGNTLLQAWHCIDSHGNKCLVILGIGKDKKRTTMLNIMYDEDEYRLAGYLQ